MNIDIDKTCTTFASKAICPSPPVLPSNDSNDNNYANQSN